MCCSVLDENGLADGEITELDPHVHQVMEGNFSVAEMEVTSTEVETNDTDHEETRTSRTVQHVNGMMFVLALLPGNKTSLVNNLHVDVKEDLAWTSKI